MCIIHICMYVCGGMGVEGKTLLACREIAWRLCAPVLGDGESVKDDFCVK